MAWLLAGCGWRRNAPLMISDAICGGASSTSGYVALRAGRFRRKATSALMPCSPLPEFLRCYDRPAAVSRLRGGAALVAECGRVPLTEPEHLDGPSRLGPARSRRALSRIPVRGRALVRSNALPCPKADEPLSGGDRDALEEGRRALDADDTVSDYELRNRAC